MKTTFKVFLVILGVIALSLGWLLADADVTINEEPKYGLEITTT